MKKNLDVLPFGINKIQKSVLADGSECGDSCGISVTPETTGSGHAQRKASDVADINAYSKKVLDRQQSI
ncbi:hypothetical protein [Lysinibacillus fusiformis]